MRVVANYEVCEANAVCERVAPEVFRVDDEDNLHILDESPPAELHDKVREAVNRCPKLALTVEA
jgi:ferredoxin